MCRRGDARTLSSVRWQSFYFFVANQKLLLILMSLVEHLWQTHKKNFPAHLWKRTSLTVSQLSSVAGIERICTQIRTRDTWSKTNSSVQSSDTEHRSVRCNLSMTLASLTCMLRCERSPRHTRRERRSSADAITLPPIVRIKTQGDHQGFSDRKPGKSRP